MPDLAIAGISTPEVIKAIQQRICFEEFWWGRSTFKLGERMNISVRRHDQWAYVWTEDLAVVPNVLRWANYFTVVSNANRTVVGYSYGYNLDIIRNSPDVEANRRKVFTGVVETTQLLVPEDCSPHIIKETPQKEHALKAIERTMSAQVLVFSKSNTVYYSNPLNIVVADFNLDYPETVVFIPSTDEVFHVALQDAADPLGDGFLTRSEYPARPEYNKQRANALREKIINHGITLPITW